jgi:hypothetical protein
MNFDKPFNYDHSTGTWSLQLEKAPKFFSSQYGIKFTINPGTPTGNSGEFYNNFKDSGSTNSAVEIKYFDNLSGWVSVVQFDLPTLVKKLIEIMPEDAVKVSTFCLADADKKKK